MMIYIQAFMSMLPYIKALLDLFITTDADKREELITKLGEAFKRAKETKDTSDLEKIISSH